MVYKDPNDKNKNIQTTIQVVDRSQATDPNGIREGDSFLAFQFNEVIVGEGKQAVKTYAFTHKLGYSFYKDEISKYMKVFEVTNVGNQTVQLDVTKEVAESLKKRADDFEIRYKTGRFDELITHGTAKGLVPVIAVGGEKPIHAKSANWFDYLLVIPVGFIMQLFSFGGIYGLGIIFATIIIKTLACQFMLKLTKCQQRWLKLNQIYNVFKLSIAVEQIRLHSNKCRWKRCKFIRSIKLVWEVCFYHSYKCLFSSLCIKL